MARQAFPRLKGFRDFPPDALARREKIFAAWRAVAGRYALSEYDGPPLESLDLYVEKSGPEIVSQLYTFKDKGGRDVTLRPEMTPSLARILAERSRALPKPIRWFSIPQLFRYERQQRGRLREHYQWNVDIVGEPGAGADAEVIAVAVEGLCELGLTEADFTVRLSHRQLLTAVLTAFGVVDGARWKAMAVIDKLARRPRADSLHDLVEETGLAPDEARELVELLGSPDALRAVGDFLERHGGGDDTEGPATALATLDECLGRLRSLGLARFVTVDLSIVRGLDYYTGIVFELFDVKGELRAICGGGRYDRLLELVGGEPLPAVGFGMGDVVLRELLADRGLDGGGEAGTDFALIVIPDSGKADRWSATREAALAAAALLRSRGCSVSYALRDLSPAKQMKAAQRAGARMAVSIGPAELEAGTVRLRDLRSREEASLPLLEVAEFADDPEILSERVRRG